MNKEELKKEIENLGLKITIEQLDKLEQYADFLLKYNEHTNLTAIKNKEEVYLKHFYDSLTLCKITDFKKETLLDIGTGAGFPGLVLAIFYPNLKVTLLDSNNKKIKFLEDCVKLLNLKNVNIIYARVEDYTKKTREYYDYVTSRAVAELRILLELGIPALKVGGNLLIMKGNILEERNFATTAMQKLSCDIEKTCEFELPKNAGHRTLLNIIKRKETEIIYPRNYDKIKKKPL